MALFSKKIGPFLPYLFFLGLAVIFFWPYFLKHLIPIPSDVLVGVYYPWRDYIWNNFVAGVPAKNGMISDVISIIYPWRILGIEMLKSGALPLWNPYALAGTPLLANFQSAVLYPFNFLFWVFKDQDAWSLYLFFQPVLAGSFLYAFLRNKKLECIPSMFGGLVFAFCGYSLAWFEYGILNHAFLWLPLILLSIDKIHSSPRKLPWFICGSLAIGFSSLAGYPQLTIYALIIAGIYTLSKIIQKPTSFATPVILNEVKNLIGILLRPRRIRMTTTLFSLLIFPFGLCLAAVQVIPGLEMLNLSLRGTDAVAGSMSGGSVPFYHLINALVPDFFGNTVTGNWWGWASYGESAVYLGVISLFFALLTLFATRFKDHLFFKLGLLLAILFAYRTPLAILPTQLGLPGLSGAISGRLLLAVDFFLAILAAYGLQIFINRQKGRRVALLVIAFIGVFSVLLVLVSNIVSLGFPSQVVNGFFIARRNLILPSGAFICFCLVTLLHYRLKIKPSFTIAVIFLITIAELFRFGQKFNPFTPSDYLYPKTALTDYLQSESQTSRFIGLLPQSVWMPYRLSSPDGYEPLLPARFGEFITYLESGSIVPDNKAKSRWVRISNVNSPLVSYFGARNYLVYTGDIDKYPPLFTDPNYTSHFTKVFSYGKTEIFRDAKALPRFFMTSDYLVETNREHIIKNLTNLSFTSGKKIILEANPGFASVAEPKPIVIPLSEVDYSANSIRLNVITDRPRLLFISDTYYPGWQAKIDGAPVQIYRSNYTFRAIPVLPGNHQIEMVYQPKSFSFGLIISLFTVSIIVSLLVYSIIRSICRFYFHR